MISGFYVWSFDVNDRCPHIMGYLQLNARQQPATQENWIEA